MPQIANSVKKQRKLAAIMFTDMVGYSALAQKDESLALELLEEHRQILRPIFPRHGGQEVETVGDAFFVEFKSALEAVHCAIEIQKTLFERNSRSESGKHIKLRIGLHVGDVVRIGKHVHGDGVNIAARLEPLSKPGGICISEDVARQIHNKIEFPLKKLRTEKLKNIQSPIDIHCVILPWEETPEVNNKARLLKLVNQRTFIYTGVLIALLVFVFLIWSNMQKASHGEKNNRIAVLPLKNISEDSQDEYFTEGMTEELISQLAKISGLNVIARTSVMKYKNAEMNVVEIGEDLNVGTILRGSVRQASEKARISVQLIDVETQEYLWSEEYDRYLKDIFAIQSDIAIKIASELKVKLITFEKQQIESMGTQNPEAYRSYLMGKYHLNKRTEESILLGLEYFQSAIELDPEYALAYVGVAECYTLIGGADYASLPREEVIINANNAVNTALDIDATLAEAYNARAYINFRLEWNWEEAEKYFKKAIEFKPSYATVYERYALCLTLIGRYDEALPLMFRAYELDPLSASVGTGVGRIYHFSRQFDKAIEQFKKILAMNPDYVEAVFALGLSYVQKQMYTEAISELKRAINLSNDRLIYIASLGHAYALSGKRDEAIHILNDLNSRQNNNLAAPFYAGIVNAALGNTDEAISSLYKAYENHFGLLVYIKASPMLDPLRSEPKFTEMLKMIGLEQ